MGMAASQARFLGLTARKTNTEYEGQQVNQQRTALANESSGLFNKMLELQVPVPPSTTDYYSTRYTFADGTQNYAIVDPYVKDNGDGTYLAKLLINIDVPTATSNVQIPKGSPIIFDSDVARTPQTVTINGKTYAVSPTDANDDENIKLINSFRQNQDKTFNPTGVTYYKYTNLDKSGQEFYLASDDIQKINQSDIINNTYSGGLSQYYVYNNNVPKYINASTTYQTGSDGRLEYAQIIDCPEEPSLNNRDFPLSIKQVQDDVGYEQAMKDYEYQKMLYERSINDINARTEIIQQQDRTLELRLKQLDTEQKALQTEMESVQSVIKKNVETTFKTFA